MSPTPPPHRRLVDAYSCISIILGSIRPNATVGGNRDPWVLGWCRWAYRVWICTTPSNKSSFKMSGQWWGCFTLDPSVGKPLHTWLCDRDIAYNKNCVTSCFGNFILWHNNIVCRQPQVPVCQEVPQLMCWTSPGESPEGTHLSIRATSLIPISLSPTFLKLRSRLQITLITPSYSFILQQKDFQISNHAAPSLCAFDGSTYHGTCRSESSPDCAISWPQECKCCWRINLLDDLLLWQAALC
jgi:hypothetical protein